MQVSQSVFPQSLPTPSHLSSYQRQQSRAEQSRGESHPLIVILHDRIVPKSPMPQGCDQGTTPTGNMPCRPSPFRLLVSAPSRRSPVGAAATASSRILRSETLNLTLRKSTPRHITPNTQPMAADSRPSYPITYILLYSLCTPSGRIHSVPFPNVSHVD
ncbi:uncharacterized protein LY89DRAFT_250254 [Mollisia scopiformis]|uniref:Uncharacterized protein n=1 Tax=Mollisia scopiformis TaxID=149040 RepID=A0A194WS12_MOLSC|nr:uncharacterized protein LY89DRAFT_250254 [Mollisia scopiformis]KUJ10763.1 hypothetical protein LY89DRAFT_250254 [Mollisia scopiformis]